MADKKFIGIKRLWYGDTIDEDLTYDKLKTWLETAKEVKNSHDGTFSYSQDDPSTTDYKNELSGKNYYRDVTDGGNKTIAFSIGDYDLATKVALQGGTVINGTDEKPAGWKAPETPQLIYKGICALTKTGNYVVFTNAGIVGKTEMQEKNMALGVTAVAMDNSTEGVSDEYWFYGED